MSTFVQHPVRHGSLITALALSCLASGCAYQRPAEVTAQMARTESSLKQAEQSGAAEAALGELQSARDKFSDAQRALEKKNKEGDRTALYLAQQAELDAQYAAARTQTQQQETAARQVAEGVEAVKREVQRDTPTESAR